MKEQAADAQVNIVILAGGFNTELVQEILTKLKEDTLGKDSSATLIRKTVVCLLCSGRLGLQFV